MYVILLPFKESNKFRTFQQISTPRMDPLIAEFPNQTWYHGRLLNGPRAATPVEVRAALQAVKWPAGRAQQPVVFVDVPHGAEEMTPSGSKINYSEACAVVQVSEHFPYSLCFCRACVNT